MCGGGGGGGRLFKGYGSNSELIYTIRLHMISGRRGGGGGGGGRGCRIFNYLPFTPPPPLLNGTALKINGLRWLSSC